MTLKKDPNFEEKLTFSHKKICEILPLQSGITLVLSNK